MRFHECFYDLRINLPMEEILFYVVSYGNIRTSLHVCSDEMNDSLIRFLYHKRRKNSWELGYFSLWFLQFSIVF